MKILNSSALSAFGGINFVLNYLEDNQFGSLLSQKLPTLKRQSTYSWSDIFYSLLSIYLCGGDCIEDLQTHLKYHFYNNPFVKIPSPDTVLKRMSELSETSHFCKTARGKVEHEYNTNPILEELNIAILKKLGIFETKELVLDYDNTIIFNEKNDSKMTYKRNYGYQPGVCTLNEEQILYIENRNGNSDAKSFQSDTLKRLFSLLENSHVRRIEHFRADAASYQYEVVKLLSKKVRYFYVGCRNSYVEKYFTKVSSWEIIKDASQGITEVGEAVITPFQKQAKDTGNTPVPYRLIVKRKTKQDGQTNIFTQDAYEYRAILTNNFDLSPVEVAQFYNHRGNMEKQFDILKNDFGWDRMPFSSLQKNTVFLYLTAICRNLYRKIITYFSERVETLKATDRVKKFLFRFIVLPAKWITRSRQKQLRLYGKTNFSP